MYVRVATKATMSGTISAGSGQVATATVAAPDSIWVGDTIIVGWDDKSAKFKVTGQDGETFQLTYAGEDTLDQSIFAADEWTIDNTVASTWVDSVGTKVLTVGKESTVADVTNDLVAIMRGEELGYGHANILGDIAKNEDGTLSISEDKTSVKLAPGGALEFVTDDIVAITRASVDLELDAVGDGGLGEANILWLGKVKTSDPITDTVTFYDAIVSDVLPDGATKLNFQLLNLTQTNKVVYAATDTCKTPADLTVSAVTGTPTYTKKTAGSLAVYKVIDIKGTVTDTGSFTADDTITVTYAGVTATGTVDSEGKFTATFAEGSEPTTSEEHPVAPVTGTIGGNTVAIDATVEKAQTPDTPEVKPIYTVTNLKVTVTTGSEYVKAKDKVTATITGVTGKATGSIDSVGETITAVFDKVDVEGSIADGADVPPEIAAGDITKATVMVSKGYSDIYIIGNYTVMVPVRLTN